MKKILRAYLCKENFQNSVLNLFKINGSLGLLDFSDYTVPKFVIYNKVINKTRTKKDQENSTHCFLDDYVRKLSGEISARKDETVESWNFKTKQ